MRKNLKYKIEDFENCNWMEAIKKAKEYDYIRINTALYIAAKEEIEKDNKAVGDILLLLSRACSMILKPESTNKPFEPIFVINGKRSTILEDFNEEELNFFKEIYDKIDDIKLRARICDILWTLEETRNPKYALEAIDSYIQIPINKDRCMGEDKHCWERAIQLTKLLGRGSGDRIKKIEDKLLKKFLHTTDEDGYVTFWISNLLLKYRFDVKCRDDIIKRLSEISISLRDKGKLDSAVDYYNALIEWYDPQDNIEEIIKIKTTIAEIWERKAKLLENSKHPNYIGASTFFDRAIQKLREIPRKYRTEYKIDEKIDHLREKYEDSNKKSLGQLVKIASPTIDITNVIESAMEQVAGKDSLEAFRALSNICPGANKDRLKKQAEEQIKKHPLTFMFSSSYISKDGRIVARRGGMDFLNESEDEVILAEMINNYTFSINLEVTGLI